MITLLKHLPLTLLASALLAGTAHADDKKDLAARVVQLQQQSAENIGRAVAGQTAQQVLQAAGGALAGVAPEKREAVAKEIQADVKKFHDEIEPVLRDRAVKLSQPTLGPLLEEKFTEDELKTIITWLESSAMKKFSQISNDMQNALSQKLVADTRPTVEPKLKALEDNLRKKLGVPADAAKPAAAKPVKK